MAHWASALSRTGLNCMWLAAPVRPGTADRFYIADTASGAVTQTATFARDRSNLTFINGITVSADGSRVYLARTDSDGSTVEVFDGDTGEKRGIHCLAG